MPFSHHHNHIPKSLGIKCPANPITFSKHIRKKRMEEYLLQGDAAKILGVTIDSVTNWENNRHVQ